MNNDPNNTIEQRPETTGKNRNGVKIAGIIGAGLLGVIIIVLLVVSFYKPKIPEIPQTPSSSTGTTQESGNDETIARAIEPCTLLTNEERAIFNLGNGEADNKNLRGCAWNSPDEVYVNTMVYPVYSLDKMPQWPESPPKPLTIDSHEAQIASGPPESISASLCVIDIAIGANKKASVRVSANGSYKESSEKYCTIVKQVAELVEPKLP